MFHTPSFGDDEFDVSAITIPYTNNTMSVSQSTPAMQPMSDIDFSMTQPLSHPMPATTNCSALTNNDRNTFVVPKFPPQNFYVPDINVTNSITQPEGHPMMSNVSMATHSNNGVHHDRLQTPLTTICQSQISSQLGFQTGMKQGSPAVSNSTGSPRSSEDSDDCLPLAQLANLKRSAQMGGPSLRSDVSTEVTSNKKQKTPKKKKKKDPNEPQKPVSAYALFFRDTQAAIKGQNTNASFGEVSKIVASMWDGLDPEHKNVYKKKTDLAKKEYLKQLAAYRASLVSQTAVEEAIGMKERISAQQNSAMNNNNSVGGGSMMVMEPMAPMEAQAPMMNFAAIQQQQQPPPTMLTNIAPRPTMDGQNMHGGMMHQQQTDQMYSHVGDYGVPMSLCSRNGCMNQAIDSPGWDNEYCSNDCVMAHCRDVFTAWVASRQNNMAFTVK